MSRAMITIVLTFALNLIGGGNPAVAFTVRFGPVPISETSAVGHEITDRDLPTPRMLNVRIRAKDMTVGPIQTAPEVPLAVPAVRVHSRARPHSADEPPAPLTHSLTPPPPAKRN